MRSIGTPITHGENESFCLLNTPQEVGLTEDDLGGIIGRKTVATVETGSLPGIVVGSLVVIGEVNHYVRRPLESDDPKLTVFLCSRNAPEGGPSEEIPPSWVGNDVPFVLSEEADGVPNARVLVDSTTAAWDRTQEGELKVHVLGVPGSTPRGEWLDLTFDGETTDFEDALTHEPNLAIRDVELIQVGIGILIPRPDGDPPSFGDFVLYGPELRSISFGAAPPRKARVHASYAS